LVSLSELLRTEEGDSVGFGLKDPKRRYAYLTPFLVICSAEPSWCMDASSLESAQHVECSKCTRRAGR
jgi:hypothetical protein